MYGLSPCHVTLGRSAARCNNCGRLGYHLLRMSYSTLPGHHPRGPHNALFSSGLVRKGPRPALQLLSTKMIISPTVGGPERLSL